MPIYAQTKEKSYTSEGVGGILAFVQKVYERYATM